MRIGNISSYDPIDISISGMRGQGKRLERISSNVANIGKATSGEGGTGPNLGAGARGAVTMADLPSQMINMNIATRAYEANVAVLKRYERMMEMTLELLR